MGRASVHSSCKAGSARVEKRGYDPCGSGVQTQLAVKKPKMKLQATMPPQKNGVALMVIAPLKARDGTRINPASKTSPRDFVKVGCFFIMKQHSGVRWSRTDIPSSPPASKPKNNVTAMASSFLVIAARGLTNINLTLSIRSGQALSK
jgi:hypothetical protein